jgi:hypothetical protein
MGQAAVDLPDPMSSDAVPAAGADDLLAQLAGAEIDRLLHEAEKDTPAGADATAIAVPSPVEAPTTPDAIEETPANPAPTPDAIAPQLAESQPTDGADVDASAAVQSELDQLFNELNNPVSPESAQATADGITSADAPANSAVTASELDDLFKQLTPDAPAAPPQPAAAAASGITIVEASSQAAPIAPEPTPAAVAAAPAAPVPTPAPATTTELGPTPWYLLPLEWLNYPLRSASPATREMLGKIAIITGFNAIFVLAYVLFFRSTQ